MAKRLIELRAQASELGLFTDDRELLTCAACGLMEDFTSDGFLITHAIESLDASDSGLRFTKRQDGHFSCSRCGADVVASENEAPGALILQGEEQVAEGKVTPVGEVVERQPQRK